ncbi:MAG: chondroitinase-B domain-containing protein [Nannocystaceae bacterium]
MARPPVTRSALALALSPALALASALAPGSAAAADLLVIGETVIDRPTLITLGVQVTLSGDDDRDARIDLRVREAGSASWTDALPLYRVAAAKVEGLAVPEQFAGSIFELRPATSYELELHALDPDGVDTTWTVMATTRPVPGDPAAPKRIGVSDAAGLAQALAAAAPGDVITLKDGTYAGAFSIDKSGTASDPIVIRGETQGGVILDGMGGGGNVLEVYGSFVHVERLTIQGANRALRFQGSGAEGNVVRRVHIRDVGLGIGARDGQRDFYLCDNLLEGPLVWPHVYGDDGGMFANVDGILVMGHGHVICHNELIGWGDAIKTEEDGARAVDIYGNLSRSAYDNAIELDGSAGNTRAFRNLLLNSWSPISFQPIFGGPAYALRNVVVNNVDEPQKLHAKTGTGETVGAILYHNTFVSPGRAIDLSTSDTVHDAHLVGNLYVGPAAPEGGKAVDWSAPIDAVELDWNGYYGDGIFDFDEAGTWPSFAAMQAAGVFEAHGVLLDGMTFDSGLAAPADYLGVIDAVDVTLAATSPAIDAGPALPGINDDFVGGGPDLGALERGCAAPIYGVRPEGVDEATMEPGCAGESDGTTSTTDATTTDASTTDATTDATGSTSAGASTTDAGEATSDAGSSGGGETSSGEASGPSTDGGATTGGEATDGSGCACRSSSPVGGAWALGLWALARGRRRR